MSALNYEPPAADNTKIAERWRAQYCRRNVWRYCGPGESSKAIYEQLFPLGDNPSSVAIVRIIGNDSWVDNVEAAVVEWREAA